MADQSLVQSDPIFPKPAPRSRLTSIGAWARRVGLARRMMLLLTVAAVLAGVTTFLTISGSGGITSNPNQILMLVAADLVLLVALGGLVIWRAAKLWAERRAGAAGAGLHVRMASLFAVLSAAPAIVLVLLAALFFGLEVQAWFSERVRTAVQESVAVAESYLKEHKQVIAADTLAMASDLNRLWPQIGDDLRAFRSLVETQAKVRSLDDAIVFDQASRILANGGLAAAPTFAPPPADALAQASKGELVILTGDDTARLAALVGLNTVPPTFLFVSRRVDPNVLQHMTRAKSAASIYDEMKTRRTGIEATFAAVFVLVALLMLLAAVAVGLNFATRLARPISALVTAAERVRSGDLTVRLDEPEFEDELGTLTRAFNRMTSQLDGQRSELVAANRQLDERRHFTEAVLAGVSAGVVGLDGEGRVNLPNRSALTLLGLAPESVVGRALDEIVPEMADLLLAARRRPAKLAEGQVTLVRGDRAQSLHVRIAGETGPGGEVQGYVVTFDDVTPLLSAQRKAAWADVARRIAHEIKNPLTPIQLAAERLRRKYLTEITSDRETFEQCTDTIVRQVGDIGRLIDEFAAFARMPAPVKRVVDLERICRESLFLQRSARPEIAYTLTIAPDAARLHCDAGLLAQALTNLLKNAAEAIDARRSGTGENAAAPGRIAVGVVAAEGLIRIAVEDNGEGLPPSDRHRLTEPYVTTRAKGTGLGLAIVKKIMEDHGGDLMMENREGGGARVSLVFPIEPSDERELAPDRAKGEAAGLAAAIAEGTRHGA